MGEDHKLPAAQEEPEAFALSAVVPTPAPRRADDSRVILAHAYYRASQAIVFSYMMGTWVAWHIRRRP
jgi:hypothetical protein